MVLLVLSIKRGIFIFWLHEQSLQRFQDIYTMEYCPMIWKVIRITTMEAEKEDAENITLFLSLFLETLQKASKNPNLKYQPRGF